MEKINEGDLGIFQNQDKVAENLKKSAQELGLNINEASIDKLADSTPQEVLVAKNSCKMCWGKGTVDFVVNHPDNNHNHREPAKTGRWKDINMKKAYCKCVKVRLV